MNFLQMLAIAPLVQSNPEPTMSKAQAKLMLEHLAEERVNIALDMRRNAIMKGMEKGKHPNVAWQDYLKSMEHLHLENYSFMGISKERGQFEWEDFQRVICQVLKEYDEGYFNKGIELLRSPDAEVAKRHQGTCPIPASVIADKLESGEMVMVDLDFATAYKWVDESRPEAQDPSYLEYTNRLKQYYENNQGYYYEISKSDITY